MSLPNPGMSFSPFAILTAEEMNDLVENIEALSDGSGLADGSVAAAKLDFTTFPKYTFLAGRSNTDGSQTIGSTYTKVLLPTVSYDQNSNFASSTYTVPVNGVYHFSWAMACIAVASLSVIRSAIYRNGLRVKEISAPASASINLGVAGSVDLLLTAGDTIELYAMGNVSFSAPGNAALEYTWLCGHLVVQT